MKRVRENPNKTQQFTVLESEIGRSSGKLTHLEVVQLEFKKKKKGGERRAMQKRTPKIYTGVPLSLC